MATVPQHLAALATANDYRLKRAQLKRDINAGAVTVRDVLKVHEVPGVDTLEDVDPAFAGMPVAELLCAQRRWGTLRTRNRLFALHVPELKPIGDLTSRRRRAIVAAIER